MLTRLLFCLFILCSALSALAQEEARLAPEVQQATELMRELPKLRLFISRAPGFGHQTATLNLMKRLRHLGFVGEFDVIYDPVTQEKLSQLIPEFKSNQPETQHLDFLGQSRFTSEEVFNRDLDRAERLPLGITGADDQSIRSADQLKVELFLKLQPRAWHRPSMILTPTESIELTTFKELPRILDLTAVDNVELALEEAMHEPTLFDKSKRLSEWMNTHEKSLLMPIYGVGVEGADRMRGILFALRDLMHQKQSTALLPVLSKLTSSERAYIERSFSDIAFVDVMTADPNQIPQARVVVLYVGQIPQRMFHLVLAKAEIAPSIAGKNAANFLHQLGKAYLSTVGDYPTEWTTKEELKVRKMFSNVQEAFSNIHLQRRDDIEEIRSYLEESLDPKSELNRFFAKVGNSYRDQSQDALIQGLNLTRKHLKLAPICRQVFGF